MNNGRWLYSVGFGSEHAVDEMWSGEEEEKTGKGSSRVADGIEEEELPPIKVFVMRDICALLGGVRVTVQPMSTRPFYVVCILLS